MSEKRLKSWVLICLVGWGGISQTAAQPRQTFSSDEEAALNWLELITGKLSKEEEKRWWQHGEKQFGVFSLRYNIAFAGYAASALGFRAQGEDALSAGNGKVRERVGCILGNCIERYLAPEVWRYSLAKSYWGQKPWTPDPCYRENVMYTGHLLQLLAFYELFTGDRRYWDSGFDFKTVHYTVQKLIDVTVRQMHEGNGGITCEPGLMFFPCNNHPHVALRTFAKLGHGDWTAEAQRWEDWALGHYRHPLFGGGALNLVYHVKTGLMYPRGSSGLDAWSLLWYESWATKRDTALELWREAVQKLDWKKLDDPDDTKGGRGCCDPEPVPKTVEAAFLCAAARACGDVSTAERLERALDAKWLVREGGLYYLDLARQWRIGATAHRIMALAESRGFSFREALH